MASISINQKIIEKLYSDYKIKGYITEESVLNEIIERDLPLDEVDYVCDQLLSMGVIIRDASIENSGVDEDDYDRSQIDYNHLFQKVIAIDNGLVPFIDEIRKIKPPQHRECQYLIPQAKSNNPFAKQRIIEMYLRTVVKIALLYHQKYKVPLVETIQDGCEGLVIALDKYETGKHDKFSTYAPWWVRQNIIRAAPALNPLIYIPINIKDKLFNIYDIIEQCYSCNQYNCDMICSEMVKKVSKKLDCSEDEAKKYISYLNPFESIEELMEKDESIFNDGHTTEEQIIVNINKKELKDAISKMLQTLSPREKKVILLRFGFIDGNRWTLEEVGNEFCVTRERIRQIEKKAIKKLRYGTRGKILKSFL